MPLRAGTHELGPPQGRLLVRTGRAGVAAGIGHDLVLEATRWSARLVVEDAGPTSLIAAVDARSLEVREGVGGAKPLSDRDRADIKRNIARNVLRSDDHPEITFESTSVEPGDHDRLAVAGRLRIGGAVRPVRFAVAVEGDGDRTRLRAEMALLQSEWGIRPFSALMGALRVADRVTVQADAVLG
jgi:polyisoprenoid-binding protein YceI